MEPTGIARRGEACYILPASQHAMQVAPPPRCWRNSSWQQLHAWERDGSTASTYPSLSVSSFSILYSGKKERTQMPMMRMIVIMSSSLGKHKYDVE